MALKNLIFKWVIHLQMHCHEEFEYLPTVLNIFQQQQQKQQQPKTSPFIDHNSNCFDIWSGRHTIHPIVW